MTMADDRCHQEQPMAPPLPLTELKYFVSDFAVDNNRMLLNKQKLDLIDSTDDEEEDVLPTNEVCFFPRKQLNNMQDSLTGLGSLESLCSVISAITLPDSLACNRRNSHIRFESGCSNSPTCQKHRTILDALPRFPFRQGSKATLISTSSNASHCQIPSSIIMPPPPPRQAADVSPRKPQRGQGANKRKDSSDHCSSSNGSKKVGKTIRRAFSSMCGSSTTNRVRTSSAADSTDCRPNVPSRRMSIASTVA